MLGPRIASIQFQNCQLPLQESEVHDTLNAAWPKEVPRQVHLKVSGLSEQHTIRRVSGLRSKSVRTPLSSGGFVGLFEQARHLVKVSLIRREPFGGQV